MKVTLSNSYNILPIQNRAKASEPLTFCGLKNVDVVESLYSKSLSKLKDFSVKEYKTLTEPEKIRLREEYSKRPDWLTFNETRHTPIKTSIIENSDIEQFHDIFTDRLKSKFNKKYGKNNYVVIIIGRSLSSVGKVLGYKIGEDKVKNIPMSASARYLTDWKLVNSLESSGSINNFRKYLNSIGLKKEDIEKSKKKYIILDYCVTGKSLAGASKLLKRDDVLGDKNIVTGNVMEYITNKNLKQNADKYFFNCTFKDLAFVEKTMCLGNMSNFSIDTTKSKDNVRLIWFKLLDNEMIKQEKSNPIKRWLNKIW